MNKPDQDKQAEPDQLPDVIRPKTRLAQILDKQLSLQMIAQGVGALGKRPFTALAAMWKREGTERTRLDRLKTALYTKRTGLTPIFRRDGTVIAEAYGNTQKALQAALTEKTSLNDLDAQGLELELLSAHQAELEQADFRRARLENCNFRRAKLRGADFSGAHFIFYRQTMGGFSQADLRGANFADARFEQMFKRGHLDVDQRLNFDGANLDGAKFSMDAPFKLMKLDQVDLNGVQLVDWNGDVVKGAKLYPNGTVLITPSNRLAAPNSAAEATAHGGPGV